MKRFNLMDVQEGVSDLPPWSGPLVVLVATPIPKCPRQLGL